MSSWSHLTKSVQVLRKIMFRNVSRYLSIHQTWEGKLGNSCQSAHGANENDEFSILLYRASPRVRENDFNFSLLKANA